MSMMGLELAPASSRHCSSASSPLPTGPAESLSPKIAQPEHSQPCAYEHELSQLQVTAAIRWMRRMR